MKKLLALLFFNTLFIGGIKSYAYFDISLGRVKDVDNRIFTESQDYSCGSKEYHWDAGQALSIWIIDPSPYNPFVTTERYKGDVYYW